MRRTTYILLISLIFVMARDAHTTSGQSHLESRIKSATTPIHTPIGPAIAGTAAETTEKTVLAKTRNQGGYFWVKTRKDKIQRFKCSQCHNGQKVTIIHAKEMAHDDIVLSHGEKNKPLACNSCHDQDKRDLLFIEPGRLVDMDHSYQLCGRCHFREKKDWIGGAHGKRLSFWAGKRVVANCTYCHNPHSPKFEKRWPRTYSLPIETR